MTQTILNGNFSSSNANWGTQVETNSESVYGGIGSNRVAEVDYQASLTQTVSGFKIGKNYSLQFAVSRRTKVNQAAPNPSTLLIKVLNGATIVVNASLTKTNASFNLAYVEYTFSAPSTSLTFSFTAGTDIGTMTRGLILDNVSVSEIIALPVDLVNFYSLTSDKGVRLNWETASENNNDYYEVHKSVDAHNWDLIEKVAGKGDTKLHSYYSVEDKNPNSGITYYRLNQVDKNGENHLSKIISNKIEREVNVYPNPTINKTIYLDFENREEQMRIQLYDKTGKKVYDEIQTNTQIDLTNLASGMYLMLLKTEEKELNKINLLID